MGSDGLGEDTGAYDLEISIHAPAWGATVPPIRVTVHGNISIHAPAWGATVAKSSGDAV